ncbi:AraC family transcriptional regulator [Tamaricihabitans halophyticus]|nr:helix-turn-helix transcriptional regulator [Tamaricihabitans halophyticus]
MLFGSLELPAGAWFPRHTHGQHQLVWAARGVAAVNVADAHWLLPPTRALWLPAGVAHRTGAVGKTELRGIYADPARCPVHWSGPRMVLVRPLLRELLEYLADQLIDDAARQRAEAVVFDLLEPVTVTPIAVPLPTDPRALAVARALLADPTDQRTLAGFGSAVGASERTLARLFRGECRMAFGHWRTQARLRAALPYLAEGMPLEAIARRVGYRTPSAFVAAFRRAVGVPPGQYFAADTRPTDRSL